MEPIAHGNDLPQRDKDPNHVPWHESHAVFPCASVSHSAPTSISPALPLSYSLESSSASVTGSFLFAEEGEISSERSPAGHSVLPSYNCRNPGGSAEGLLHDKLFADVDTQAGTTLMDKAEYACLLGSKRSLIQGGMYTRAGGINPTRAYKHAGNYSARTHKCPFSALHSLHM